MRLWKILASIVALTVIVFVIAILRSCSNDDGVGVGCPDYGITETKLSPDSRWVAEVGVEGCLQGGATSVLLRRADEPQEFSKNQRVEVFGDFPIIHLRWTANSALTIMLPDNAHGGTSPPVWRGITLTREKYIPTDEEKSKHLVIGQGKIWYE